MSHKNNGITFLQANIYLRPEEYWNDIMGKEGLKDYSAKVKLLGNNVKYLLHDKYPIDLVDLRVPMSVLGSGKVIGDYVSELLGDFSDNLGRLEKLVDCGVVDSVLSFNNLGLCDGSNSDALSGKKIGNWIQYACSFTDDFNSSIFPKNYDFSDVFLEFVPTFVELRSYGRLVSSDKDVPIILGDSFAGAVDNYILMHQSVVDHIDYLDAKEHELMMRYRKNPDSLPSDFISRIPEAVVKYKEKKN